MNGPLWNRPWRNRPDIERLNVIIALLVVIALLLVVIVVRMPP